MKGNIVLLSVVIFYVSCVSLSCADSGYELKPEIVYDYDNEPDESSFSDGKKQVSSTVYKTVNQYYCSLDSILEDSHLIVYGTREWTFPEQNVNLTLSYPSVDEEDLKDVLNSQVEYLITGFKVILYIDGKESKGYIVSGGVMKEQISLSFVTDKSTLLRYEFWLYGARKDTSNIGVEMNAHYRLCH